MSRRAQALIWLATTVLVALVAVWVYDRATRVPDYAGRTEPARLLDDPGLLFEEPGILGSAVEIRVTEAVRSCMDQAGYDYRGPVQIAGLDDGYDPAVNGYGIAAPLEPPTVRLENPVRGSERPGYEEALYGTGLDDAGTPGGCAAVGAAELDRAVAELVALPYSIEELEDASRSHPAYRDGLEEWVECMAAKGYSADSPEALVVDLTRRLAESRGDQARALAEEERRTAADDFACRERTIEPALREVADDVATEFVEANREQLEAFIPEPAGGGAGLPPDLGGGDVQVTLLWDSGVDLDLHVIDPAGDEIYYQVKTSDSGGRLDRDANGECEDEADPIENIYWPTGAAPSGEYRVRVEWYWWCGIDDPQRFELVIQVDGRVVDRITRTLEPDAVFETEFTVR